MSSGFGAATARAFAATGHNIAGVHLDRRSGMAAVEALQHDLKSNGASVQFFNVNAADDTQREDVVSELRKSIPKGGLRVMLHSLAFGALRPYIAPPNSAVKTATRKQIEMTMDVMSSSLIYWTQGVVNSGLMSDGGRVFTLTSSGSRAAWADYGPVSAAKAAMESNVRQLCHELAPHGITINGIMAGVTKTPALDKIPNSEGLISKALSKNPHNRLTLPEDVAMCLVELARAGTYWMTGNTICVDGGEDHCA